MRGTRLFPAVEQTLPRYTLARGESNDRSNFRHSDTLLRVVITLNGDPHDLSGPLTVAQLLSQLKIDPRRVAVELNLVVLKRATFDTALVQEGDRVEIVNFVGGG